MNGLRQTLGLIRTSLGQLTVSQRLLIAALMVVGLMSLMLVALTTSRSVMVELLPGMAGADQGRPKEYLASIDVPYEMKSGKVMVAADKRTQVLAMMGQAGQLPENTGLLFANLANHQNWMNSKSMNHQWANIALQNELARVIAYLCLYVKLGTSAKLKFSCLLPSLAETLESSLNKSIRKPKDNQSSNEN